MNNFLIQTLFHKQKKMLNTQPHIYNAIAKDTIIKNLLRRPMLC